MVLGAVIIIINPELVSRQSVHLKEKRRGSVAQILYGGVVAKMVGWVGPSRVGHVGRCRVECQRGALRQFVGRWRN